jgi:hypothetical protein
LGGVVVVEEAGHVGIEKLVSGRQEGHSLDSLQDFSRMFVDARGRKTQVYSVKDSVVNQYTRMYALGDGGGVLSLVCEGLLKLKQPERGGDIPWFGDRVN